MEANLGFLSADSHNDYMVMAFTSVHLNETHLLTVSRGSKIGPGRTPPLSLELVPSISKYLKSRVPLRV